MDVIQNTGVYAMGLLSRSRSFSHLAMIQQLLSRKEMQIPRIMNRLYHFINYQRELVPYTTTIMTYKEISIKQ